MAITVYVYVVVAILLFIISSLENLSIIIIDLFNSVGNILSIVNILFFLYVTKFYEIYKNIDINPFESTPNSNENRNNNSYTNINSNTNINSINYSNSNIRKYLYNNSNNNAITI